MFELRRRELVGWRSIFVSGVAGTRAGPCVHFHASPKGLRGFVIPCVHNTCSHMFPYVSVSFIVVDDRLRPYALVLSRLMELR